MRWCFLFLCGFSLNSVSLESWWLLSSIPWADCSRVSLSLSLGVSIRAWLVPRSVPWALMRPCLVPWLIPCRPGERWRPRGPSHRSYLCLGRVSACEYRSLLDGGAFHFLCGGLALSWRWVPSRASSWCCVVKSRTAGVFALLRPSFVCSRPFAPSLATAECSSFVDMRERQDGGLCQDEDSWGRVLKFSSSSMSESLRVPKYACLSRL